jgi:hypothetical protein
MRAKNGINVSLTNEMNSQFFYRLIAGVFVSRATREPPPPDLKIQAGFRRGPSPPWSKPAGASANPKVPTSVMAGMTIQVKIEPEH